MLCIVSPATDPFFNLAAEEYLFKNFSDDICFLYINDPSVVVGKHQNAMAEINPLFVFENEVKVIRRMSGGGAVYHDNENLNFSFHKTVEDTAKVSFRSFNIPVVDLLRQLGVPAEISKRNDILVNGCKVSGHAQHVFRNKVLSHGTLLIESNLEKLSGALKNGTGIYESKAIPSVRSKVANVSGFMSKPFSTSEFRDILIGHILKTNSDAKEYCFSASDLNSIKELIKNKYSSWEWNFGYSPVYRFNNKMTSSPGITFSCQLSVEKGIISNLELEADKLFEMDKEAIKRGLENKPHQPEILLNFLESRNDLPIPPRQFLELFF
jgi:lipoate---protein ligase